jgi:hypothetical protein
VWVQALNPFEHDTARNEAQIARARLTAAIKEYGGDEQAKVRMFFFEDGREAAVEKLVDAKVAEHLPKAMDSLRNDPDWTERLQILDRGMEDTAMPLEPEEQQLVSQIGIDFAGELNKRLTGEREFFSVRYSQANDEELWADYLEWYIERRTAEVQLAEYRLHQVYFGVRDCKGVEDAGTWDHSACDGHRERLFLDKEEVRQAPEMLQAIFMTAVDDIDMSVREAKNLVRQGSSFGSSPLPSEAGESTASTPTETRVAPPTSSSSPYPTPSTSSAGAS